MKAELVVGQPSDIRVVNSARVSFNKESKGFSEQDGKLLKYLANHNHWTPFSHCRITFESDDFMFNLNEDWDETDLAGMVWDKNTRKVQHSLYGWINFIKKHKFFFKKNEREIAFLLSQKYPESMKAYGLFTDERNSNQLREITPEEETNTRFMSLTMRETVPIFVARQRFKHMVGFTYNEVSRRYVDDDPDFFAPDVWRKRPDKSVKQGSGEDSDPTLNGDCFGQYYSTMHSCYNAYDFMIDKGIAPEQARMVLPQAMYTSYYVTGCLPAWAKAYKQRIDPHAQKEIRDLAAMWNENISKVFPNEWDKLIG